MIRVQLSGTVATDSNGNQITIYDQDPDLNYATNSIGGLAPADDDGNPTSGPFGPNHTIEGVDFFGPNGLGGPDGIADSLNTMLDNGTLVVHPGTVGV